jgi:hypothetical protein
MMQQEARQQQQVQEEEEYQQVSFRKIEELESYGIAKADISKLKAGGFHTIEAVSSMILLPSLTQSLS